MDKWRRWLVKSLRVALPTLLGALKGILSGLTTRYTCDSEPIYGLAFETVLEMLSHAPRVNLRFVREPEQLPVQTASERKKSHGIIMKRGSNLRYGARRRREVRTGGADACE